MMSSRILHGQPIPSECAVVEATTIRDGHEFEDLNYSNEEEEIEKLVDAKGLSFSAPHKDNIVETHSSLIVLS
jgi:hypothetical protein